MNTTKYLFLAIALLSILLQAKAENKYIMHSSQLVLGCGDGNMAKILSRTDSRAQKLELVKRTDGSFNIMHTEANGTRTFLSKSGSWDTKFANNGESADAIWKIEEAGSFVRIKCTANNLYLGTDASTAGSNVYSNKSGNEAKHAWYLADKSTEVPKPDTLSYVVNPAVRRQAIEGWGVSLCWWARMCGAWSDKQIDQLVDWLVSPTGLNYNIFRYNIGGGDDPQNAHCTPHHMGSGKGLRAEMEGFQDERGGDFIWSRDEGQRKIMLKIKEKRPDAIFEAFSNSCPWWMTYSGCCAGNADGSKDNLRPEYYEDFARYLVEVCKHYKEEYGIEFRTLEPFNESMTSYWYAGGSQEGCHFDVKSQIAFIKVLYPILQESGLSTVISASDETNVWNGQDAIQQYKNAGIIKMIGQWNTHTYSADNTTRSKVGSLARSLGLRQWMSETGAGGNGLQGNLNMALRLINDVRYMLPDAWVDWQYVEENNDQWCLVRAAFDNPSSATRVKNYYVRQHFTRFIKAGYSIVSSLNDNTLCALSPDEKEMVLVMVNPNTVKSIHKASLRFCQKDGIARGYATTESSNLAAFRGYTMDDKGELTVTMPAQSIVTLIIPVTNVPRLDASNLPSTAVIVPQLSTSLALTAKSNSVTVEDNTYSDNQIWSLIDNGNNTFKLMSRDSLYLGYTTSSYALMARTSKSLARAIAFDKANDYFYRINIKQTSKFFDLQNGSATPGTVVGSAAYTNGGADTSRHWMLVGIDAAVEPDEDNLSQFFGGERANASYDLQGRPDDGRQKGIFVLCMSDGSTKKILRR